MQQIQTVCNVLHSASLQAERLTYLGVAIQGSTESLIGTQSLSTAPLGKPPSTPSQLVSVPPAPCDRSTSLDHPTLAPPQPSGADLPDTGTDDAVLQLPAALTAAQQLAEQLKALLSGQFSQQCESTQVGASYLSCCLAKLFQSW